MKSATGRSYQGVENFTKLIHRASVAAFPAIGRVRNPVQLSCWPARHCLKAFRQQLPTLQRRHFRLAAGG